MCTIAENETVMDKENLPELAVETRKLVFDQMGAEDKDRFSSSDEIYGLEMYGISKDFWKLYVIREKYDNHNDRKSGFRVEFEKENEKNCVKCVDMEGKTLWSTELEPSTDVFQCALQHFMNFLTCRQKSIKKLLICGHFLENVEFGVENLESLDDLEIEGDANIDQFLPKIGHPLRKLRVLGTKNAKVLESSEEIYKVTNLLYVPGLKLNNDQFLALSATHVRISIGELTTENLVNFIKNWQKKESINKLVGYYQWDLNNSTTFDFELFCNRLEIFDLFRYDTAKTIRQDGHRGDGELFHLGKVLRFSWKHPEPRPPVVRQAAPAPVEVPAPEVAPAAEAAPEVAPAQEAVPEAAPEVAPAQEAAPEDAPEVAPAQEAAPEAAPEVAPAQQIVQ